MKTLFRDMYAIVTGDGSPAAPGSILAENGVITAVGDVPPGTEADETVDCSGIVCYPGLINTHHHLYQFFSRNLPETQGLELFPWLKKLYGVWSGLNEDTMRLAALSAMGELLKCGCTTCFDHHYVFPAGAGDLIGAEFEAAEALGMRFHASRGSMDLSEKDGGLPPDSVVQTIDAILADSERQVKLRHDPAPHSMRRVALAPCSPFSVTGDLMRETAALARGLGVRLHTHLCETRDEERFTLERFGMRPYDYMESLGWTGPDVWYAHGIHFTDLELNRLAASGTGVAHCPISNMKLASGAAKLPEMLKKGVPVGLAVDGSASNDGSSMLEELRVCYLLHRHERGAEAPSPADILGVATRGSAALLGRDDIGAIAPGMCADMFMIDAGSPEFAGALYDPAALPAAVGVRSPVAMTVVNGRVVVRDGRLVNIDERRLAADAASAVAAYLGR